MENKTIKELTELFTGIVHYVYSFDIEPAEIEEIIINLKNKYFSKDEFGEKLFHKFNNEFREKLYSLPDLNSRTAFVIETIYWLELSIFEENKINDIIENNNPENNYNNNIIYEFIYLTYHLQNRVICKIIDYCEFFYIDFDKAYNKAKQISNNDYGDTQTETNNTPPTFANLFKFPYNKETKIKELKTILKTSGYIDNNYKWVGITKEKTELANLYWLFQDKENIIETSKITPQLKTFYTEFGLNVYTDNEPSKGYCTIRTISTHTGENQTYKEFERLFYNWISKE